MPATSEIHDFLATLDDVQREEVLREAARAEKMAEIAKYRWLIADSKSHRLANGQPLDFEKYPYQVDIYQDTALELVVMGSVQWGKYLKNGTLIKTPDGSTPIDLLCVGDLVVNVDGGSSRVIGVYPQGVQKLYKVTFGDGRWVEAGWDHLWEVVAGDSGIARIVTTEAIHDLIGTASVRVPKCPDLGDGRSLGIDTRIKSIEYSCDDRATCIMVDHPRHLYITDNYVVTHNTEFTISSSAAFAAVGMNVFYVISKDDKRDRFVSARITPAFREIPLYRKMLETAKARSADTDSARMKAFGLGSINFVGSNSEKNFTSYQADVAIIDEHQECVLENLQRIDGRMSGSSFRGKIIVGNPRLVGTEENGNLDWEYQNSDRRQWHVPCDYCGLHQALGWWTHFVKEERRNGAILTVEPRDPQHEAGDRFDLRPICTQCSRPMNRLKKGKWVASNPGHHRHGFQLSNLYNVNVRMDRLFNDYRAGLTNPSRMATFVNDQLGMAWNMEGSSITETMLQNACTGNICGLPPYRMIQSNQLDWMTI